MVPNSLARSYGRARALRAAGITPTQFGIVKSAVHTFRTEGSFDIMMAKAAARLFELADMRASDGYPIFVKLAALRPEQWSPAYAPFTEAFMETMVRRCQDPEIAGHLKAAAGNIDTAANFVSNAFGGGGKIAPSLLNTLLMGSVLLGSGTGALGWHLGRDMSQDDIDNAKLREQIRTYQDLADEVNREVNLRKLQVSGGMRL